MSEEWFTYQDLGERLGISAEAARQKAIRGHWPRRTANDGKTQVRVDVEDVRASTPVRKPKDERPSDDDTTVVEQASERSFDTHTFDALEAHIATLKVMAAKAEEMAERERERATAEQARADRERDRADAERARTDALTEELKATQRTAALEHVKLEADLTELRRVVGELRRPWWKRLAS